MIYFSHVASWSHTFRYSAHIPDGPPTLPVHSYLTTIAIYYPAGGLFGIANGCMSIRTKFTLQRALSV